MLKYIEPRFAVAVKAKDLCAVCMTGLRPPSLKTRDVISTHEETAPGNGATWFGDSLGSGSSGGG